MHGEFSYELIGERILKIGPHFPKSLSNIEGYTIWDTVYLKRHSLGKNSQCQRIAQCCIDGELWNRKPVFEKSRVCMPYRGLCVPVRRAPLDIIVPPLCPGRKKFLAPPLQCWKKTTELQTASTLCLKQELSYRKQIAHQLRTQYVEGIYRPKK